LHSIVAHELCHVRRHDNLAAAIHMSVEALFWFHPLVWWIEARLVEERERACDEAVLHGSRDPEVYAEGILMVCKFCLASPLACVSGVTGANLKQRIESIMLHRQARNLTSAGKLLLAAAGLAALAAPLFLGAMNAPPAHAQTTSVPPPAFEVASVKINKSGERRMGSRILPGGRYSATNVPVDWLIAEAYHVPIQSSRLSGGPEWIRTDNYDVEAKADKDAFPPGATATVREARMMLMLQTLLADRFKLKMRRDSRELPVYALGVSKNGPKLQKSAIEEKDCTELPPDTRSLPCHVFNGGQGRGLHGDAVDMSDLVLFVENWSDRPILDKTGIIHDHGPARLEAGASKISRGPLDGGPHREAGRQLRLMSQSGTRHRYPPYEDHEDSSERVRRPGAAHRWDGFRPDCGGPACIRSGVGQTGPTAYPGHD
jgi:bla regulator protein blaR1